MSNERHHPVTRRSLLQSTAACAAVASTPWLGACASKPSAPPVPPKPIALLAVLPVALPPTEQNMSFNNRRAPVYMPVQSGSGGGMSAGGAVAVIGVGLIVAAIVASKQAENRKEQAALAEALATVNFDPAEAMDQRLNAALQQRGVRTLRVEDSEAAGAFRRNQSVNLPEGVDAVLDITISESGYYRASSSVGYSPILQLNAALRRPVRHDNDIEEFGYYADYRHGGKDKRWLTAPTTMVFPSVDLLRTDVAAVRAGFETLMDRIVAVLADDIQRHAQGQLRVD